MVLSLYGVNKMSLVKKAVSLRPKRKKSRTKYSYSKEQIELALAWVNDEVGVADVCRAMGMSVENRAGSYGFLALALKKYIKEI